MKANTNPKCPSCGKAGQKHGKRGNKARYRCINSECARKTFVENPQPTGAPTIGDRPMTAAERQKKRYESLTEAERAGVNRKRNEARKRRNKNNPNTP